MAHLLVIELPGGNDADILQAAVDGGHTFSFLSAELEHYRRQPVVAPLLSRAAFQIEATDFSPAALERQVLAVHRQHAIDAVLCLIDIRLIEAARLAESLGVPHLRAAAAERLRDKYKVRCRLAQAGLPQPPFALATSTETLKDAVAQIGLPVLVKPVDGYGSQNIVVLRTPEDLAPQRSPLEIMLPSHADYGLGVLANDRLLVERYLAGTLVGCDTLTVNGRHQLLGVHEKHMFAPPSFAIRGSCFQTAGPAFDTLASYVSEVLNALEFNAGATHIELMLTADGPRVIEVNPRLVGARMPRLVSHALGRSVHADLIRVHLGEWPQALSAPGPLPQAAAIRWFTADRTGILDRVECPPATDPCIREVAWLARTGDAIGPPFENADRLGYVMTCADTRAEAEAAAERHVAAARIHYREDALTTTS